MYLYESSIAAGPNANPVQNQAVLTVKGSFRPTHTRAWQPQWDWLTVLVLANTR